NTLSEFFASVPDGRAAFMTKLRELGVDEGRVSDLTFTHWEAVFALCLNKHFMSLAPLSAITDGHPDTKPAFSPNDSDNHYQEQHLKWLSSRERRIPQPVGESAERSAFEDACDKVNGFIHRLGGEYWLAIQQLQVTEQKRQRLGREALGRLVRLL